MKQYLICVIKIRYFLFCGYLFCDLLNWFHVPLMGRVAEFEANVLNSRSHLPGSRVSLSLTHPFPDQPASRGFGNLATMQRRQTLPDRSCPISSVELSRRLMGRRRLRGREWVHHGDGRTRDRGGNGRLVHLKRCGCDSVPLVGPSSRLTGSDLLLPFPAAGDMQPQPVLRYLRALLCRVWSQSEAGCSRWDGPGWALAKVTTPPWCCPQTPRH